MGVAEIVDFGFWALNLDRHLAEVAKRAVPDVRPREECGA